MGEDERDLTVEFDGDHIRVELGPDYKIDPDNQQRFWQDLKALSEKHESRRVLVEGYVPKGERKPPEVIDAGKRAGAAPNLWIAFHLKAFLPNKSSELFEVIARGSGVRVGFFANRDQALKWLRYHTPR